MFTRVFLIIFFILSLSCSKENVVYDPKIKIDPYKVYQEALSGFEKGDYFFAQKKFLEAELYFGDIKLAAKSSIMASYSLYSINFFDDALQNLERYLKKYPVDENIVYAYYLISIINFEQISDEKKDIGPLLTAKDDIDFFLKKFPESEYAIDLRFKRDLVINQLAAKELFVAKYYISTQKWIPAINRLKKIVKDYDQTIFIEEALHRLVEINYYLGLQQESEKYAKILGYNYNSSEWFEQSYKILNKDYKIVKKNKINQKDGLIKRIIDKIK